ncbi:A/G-specific adenine glycosylase [Catalinimonas niigatensis]|uniref:A/G-specific adenine glycosylase n=1 Tax=Catalinimonas niigatensis TaxID=1397264 RepID=UPI002666C8C0|nr:A/G-specific adenine glycosylase [Catalinimonas niigatensis]WPP53499.1 A/G-specific adenine glycosylase [Catalinimonas niigatensis]
MSISSALEPNFFSEKIIHWYQKHKRDLPWRHTRDPYLIWLSEIILQQTRVKQGLPYFHRFVEAFPTIYDLAEASEQEVLRLWQGLGYYSRARNLHSCAKTVVASNDGEFPLNYKELRQLKGIGTYTAAAIASFAYNEKVAVVDGNVYRVLARVFGLKEDILSTKGQHKFQKLADMLVPDGLAGEYNQAIMEFGALQCTPRNPACLLCPLNTICFAYQHTEQSSLPVKIKKVKIKKRYLSYILIRQGDKIYMKERTSKDIWRGLYDFYSIESKHEVQNIEKLDDPLVAEIIKTANPTVEMSGLYRHQLTHQQLWVRFFTLILGEHRLADSLLIEKSLTAYNVEEVKNLPKPILIDNYLSEVIF